MDRKRITMQTLMKKKENREVITRTCLYDYPMAKLAEEAGIDIILVGDSIANVMFGYENTFPAQMDIMVEHAKAVRRGAPTAFIIGDMPFLSYQVSIEDAIRNAGRYLKEVDMDCVKVEGGLEVLPVIEALTSAGIPVWGHTGLTPQSIKMVGGYRAQGRGADLAFQIVNIVDSIAKAGAFAITAEAIPLELGKVLHERASDYLMFSVGCGHYSDGPIINLYDLLGFHDKVPTFAKKYGNLKEEILRCLKQYILECEERTFPGPEHCYKMLDGEGEKLLKMLADSGK